MKYIFPIIKVFTGLLLIADISLAQEVKIDFDLPAGDLASSIEMLAKQANLNALFDRQLLDGKKAPALKGTYNPKEALEKLLAGSGLVFIFTGEKSVAIKAAAGAETQGVTELSPIVVESTPERTYAVPDASSATKTDTPIMETPISIQVVPQQVLQDQKALTLDQVLVNSSGVFSGGGEGTQESITLRGFFTTTTFRDGVRIEEYSATGGGTLGDITMANVESVEVLKGPAAILYGRLEPGGMVNIITKQPKDEFYAAAEQVVGSWAKSYTDLDVTGPLNTDKTLLYRVNAATETSNYWRDRVNTRTNFIAPVLEWKINSGSTITLSTEFRRETLLANVGQVVPVNPATDQMTFVNPTVNAFYNPFDAHTTSIDLKWSQEFNKDWSMKLKLIYNDVSEPILPGYYPNDTFQSGNTWMVDEYLSLSGSDNTTKAAVWDFTGHFDTYSLKHTLLFGADAYYTQVTFWGGGNYSTFFTTSLSNPGVPYLPPDPTQSDIVDFYSSNYGIYLQDQIKLPYQIFALAGVRYQNFRDETDSTQPLGTPIQYAQGDFDHAFTPRYGLLWRPITWLSLYGSYTENFGANNGFDYQDKPLSPEEAQQYEVGAKTEFYGGKLTSSVALFNLAKTNVAAPDPLHPPYSLTIGKIRSKGIEYDIQGEIHPGWQLITNFTMDQTEVVNGGPVGSAYITGDPLPGVPIFLYNFWSVYKFQENFIPGLKIGAGANWRDGSQYPQDPNPALTTPSYWVFSLMGAYERKVMGTKVSFQVNVNNLLNAFYYNWFYPVPSQSYTFLNYGDPRSIVASLKVEL